MTDSRTTESFPKVSSVVSTTAAGVVLICGLATMNSHADTKTLTAQIVGVLAATVLTKYTAHNLHRLLALVLPVIQIAIRVVLYLVALWLLVAVIHFMWIHS